MMRWCDANRHGTQCSRESDGNGRLRSGDYWPNMAAEEWYCALQIAHHGACFQSVKGSSLLYPAVDKMRNGGVSSATTARAAVWPTFRPQNIEEFNEYSRRNENVCVRPAITGLLSQQPYGYDRRGETTKRGRLYPL
jgi:hypothetical protein